MPVDAHLDVKPGTVQEVQRGGTGRPRAQRYLLLQPLQAAPELRSPAAGQGRGATRGSATERHGLYHRLPRRSPPTHPYLCFSSALCTDLRKRPG